MTSVSSAARRGVRLLGLTSAAALAITGLSAGTASAGLEAGSFVCQATQLSAVPGGNTLAGWDGVQKDRNNYTEAQVAAMEAQFLADKAAAGDDVDLVDIKKPVKVDVYYHIVRTDGTVDGGNIPRTWLRAQNNYMNHAYRGHGDGEPGARSPFKFHLMPATRTTNPTWYSSSRDPSVEREMKTALREKSSTAETLNIYLTNLTAQGLLGYATFPSDYKANSVLDGVVAESQSLPGGNIPNYNMGGTVAHEAGHWFGLYHTFQGGCSEPGDRVEDTPAQAEPTTGCPESADTCAADPGNDPIHNYMDYSYDECYNQFTIGQRERMVDQWYTYRDGVTLAAS
jgi:hypothetical protein